MIAARNGMLWRMPSMVKASSASACASIACVARLRVRDELGDHRIVVERDFAALGDAGVVAHRHAVVLAFGGRTIAHQASDRRRKIAIGILGIDAAFDRPAVELDVALLERELLAGRDADHLLDEIDAGDELGHRVLDLQPRVHFQEIEAAILRRRRIPPCRRCRSRPPWRARPPARPSSRASSRRAAGSAIPR